jgi:hypothetical protein
MGMRLRAGKSDHPLRLLNPGLLPGGGGARERKVRVSVSAREAALASLNNAVYYRELGDPEVAPSSHSVVPVLRGVRKWKRRQRFSLAAVCGLLILEALVAQRSCDCGADRTLRYADVAADLVFAYGVDDKLISLVCAVWIENDGLI